MSKQTKRVETDGDDGFAEKQTKRAETGFHKGQAVAGNLDRSKQRELKHYTEIEILVIEANKES